MKLTETIQIIRNTASKLLLEEIDFWMGLDRDDDDNDYTEADALYDIDGTDMGETPAIKRSMMAVEIALGYYVPMTQEQYDNAQSMGDKRRAFPKFKGVHYYWK